MEQREQDRIRDAVRDTYRKAATGTAGTEDTDCGSAPASSCCGASPQEIQQIGLQLGYSADELAQVPEGANLGLGCGNPQAIAALQPGEVVVDLGAGAGFDAFLAARQVGEKGRVIGVDMTPEMVAKARKNAREADVANAEFRLGEIEHLPVPNGTADVIISNCVINLSPDKPQVFREAFRILKPGGRIAVSDVVATVEIPEEARDDLALLSGCMSGASLIDDLVRILEDAGFEQISIRPRDESREFIREWAPGSRMEEYVVSAAIEAIKPTAP